MIYSNSMYRKRRRLRQPLEIQEVFQNKGVSVKVRNLIPLYRIRKEWEVLVGASLAKFAAPSRIEKDRLVIRVENPTWAQHLSFVKEDILFKLKQSLNFEFKDLQFESGKITPFVPFPQKANPDVDWKTVRKPFSEDDSLSVILARVAAKLKKTV